MNFRMFVLFVAFLQVLPVFAQEDEKKEGDVPVVYVSERVLKKAKAKEAKATRRYAQWMVLAKEKCFIFVNNEYVGRVKSNKYFNFYLRKGQNIIEFKDSRNGTIFLTKEVDIIEPIQEVIRIDGIPEKVILGSFTDNRDKKVYPIVTIGNQTWMAQNLCFESPNSAVNSAYLDNSYGRVYTWADAKKVCPVGWHLPKRAEWNHLITYIGDNAADKIRVSSAWDGFTAEDSPNKYHLSVKPAGYQYSKSGVFKDLGQNACFWTATNFDKSSAWYRAVGRLDSKVIEYHCSKDHARSVRCVKN